MGESGARFQLLPLITPLLSQGYALPAPPEGKLFIPLIPIIILPFVWVYKEKSSGGVLFAVDFFLQRVEIQRET